MRNSKSWLTAAYIAIALVGCLLVIETASMRMATAQGRGLEDHWRYHDGHWSTYNAVDKRWYYTNAITGPITTDAPGTLMLSTSISVRRVLNAAITSTLAPM
jgi:hypothetical protein